MIRLFTAIEIPANVKEQLIHQAGIDKKLQHLFKPARKEQIHLTLRFIGETSQPQLIQITEQLAHISISSFTLTITEYGQFPPQGSPNIIHAAVSEKPELINLKNQIDYILEGCGINKETRPYSPHITLARAKKNQWGNSRILPVHRQFPKLKQKLTFFANSFSLIQSNLQPQGAAHHIVKNYHF